MSGNLEAIRTGYYSIGKFPEGENGVDRLVRYDLNAFAEMERIYGSMEAANDALTKGSMTDVRRILWLGLIHDQAILDEITGEPIKYKLSMYEVGQWLTPANMREVMEKLNTAISGSVPEEAATPAGTTPAAELKKAKAESNLTELNPTEQDPN